MLSLHLHASHANKAGIVLSASVRPPVCVGLYAQNYKNLFIK